MNNEEYFSFEEDDGVDFTPNKPTLEELEKELEGIEKVERQKTIKKAKHISKFVVLGVVLVVIGVIVGIVLYNPTVQRVLPFNDLKSTDGNYVLGDKDYSEGSYYVSKMQGNGVILKDTGLLQTPSAYGYHMATISKDANVEILGEAFDSENNEEVNYILIQYEDKQGFISKNDVDNIWIDNCDIEPLKEEIEEKNNEDIKETKVNSQDLLVNLQLVEQKTNEIAQTMQPINDEIQAEVDEYGYEFDEDDYEDYVEEDYYEEEYTEFTEEEAYNE